MTKRRNIIRGLVVFLFLGIAFGLMAYPFIANYVFENRADSIVSTIEQSAQDANTEEYEEAIAQAVEYNETLANGHIQLKDPFSEEALDEAAGDYGTLLCMTDDGVMGFIEIPSIDVSLPIYHGTSADVLERGVGHLEGTSLPVGGESTHSVLTGHSGLSNAKLFTDLTELVKNDVFFLHIMGEMLAYQVDQIKVVLPSELNDLYIESGKDYCTLITCTPYGVNTHRLLVRGVRTDYEEVVSNPETFEVKKVESKWMAEYQRALLISLVFLAVCMSVVLIRRRHLSRKASDVVDDFC